MLKNSQTSKFLISEFSLVKNQPIHALVVESCTLGEGLMPVKMKLATLKNVWFNVREM